MLQPAVVLLTIVVGVIAMIYLARRGAGAAADRVMQPHGLRRVTEPANARIDFSVTMQWPDARGIDYVRHHATPARETQLIVAEVACWLTSTFHYAGAASTAVGQIRQTVVACRFPNREMPRFWVCPRAWSPDYVKNAVALPTGDAAFDAAFAVVAPAQTDPARVLTEPVRRAMLERPTLMLASGHESVLLFDQGVVLPPADLDRMLQLAEAIRRTVVS